MFPRENNDNRSNIIDKKKKRKSNIDLLFRSSRNQHLYFSMDTNCQVWCTKFQKYYSNSCSKATGKKKIVADCRIIIITTPPPPGTTIRFIPPRQCSYLISRIISLIIITPVRRTRGLRWGGPSATHIPVTPHAAIPRIPVLVKYPFRGYDITDTTTTMTTNEIKPTQTRDTTGPCVIHSCVRDRCFLPIDHS